MAHERAHSGKKRGGGSRLDSEVGSTGITKYEPRREREKKRDVWRGREKEREAKNRARSKEQSESARERRIARAVVV